MRDHHEFFIKCTRCTGFLFFQKNITLQGNINIVRMQELDRSLILFSMCFFFSFFFFFHRLSRFKGMQKKQRDHISSSLAFPLTLCSFAFEMVTFYFQSAHVITRPWLDGIYPPQEIRFWENVIVVFVLFSLLSQIWS